MKRIGQARSCSNVHTHNCAFVRVITLPAVAHGKPIWNNDGHCEPTDPCDHCGISCVLSGATISEWGGTIVQVITPGTSATLICSILFLSAFAVVPEVPLVFSLQFRPFARPFPFRLPS